MCVVTCNIGAKSAKNYFNELDFFIGRPIVVRIFVTESRLRVNVFKPFKPTLSE